MSQSHHRRGNGGQAHDDEEHRRSDGDSIGCDGGPHGEARYIGTEAIFEGKEGLFDTLGPDWNRMSYQWSGRIMAHHTVRHEGVSDRGPHSCADHGDSQAGERERHPSRSVVSVTVKTIARAVDILADPTKYRPDTKETADHSLPYVVSAAIADRMITPLQFADDKLRDPVIEDCCRK